MKVEKNLYMFRGKGYGSNTYVISGKAKVLVDSGTAEAFPELLKEMEADRIKAEDISLIVNTHCHIDHIGGNSAFREKSKAKIASHIHDSVHIKTAHPRHTCHEFFPYLKIIPVDVDHLLKGGEKIESFTVMHTPGHTKGSICLYDKKAGILISGDTLFANSYVGRTDLPGGDYSELNSSLAKLNKLKIKKIYPGHGEPFAGY